MELETTCWADALTATERRELARMLARQCKRSFDARRRYGRRGQAGRRSALTALSAELSNLYTDVTERASVPAGSAS